MRSKDKSYFVRDIQCNHEFNTAQYVWISNVANMGTLDGNILKRFKRHTTLWH